MLLKETDFDGEGINAEVLQIIYHERTNKIELAFFKDCHYVDGININLNDIKIAMGD